MGEPLGPQATDASRVYRLTLSGAYGSASLAGHFSGSETFTAKIWPGGSYAALAAPACAWESDPSEADSPAILMTVTPAMLAGLEPGDYQVSVIVDPDEQAFLGSIRVIAAAGTDELPRTYCDLADMEEECSWIMEVENLERSRGTRFLQERAAAARDAERQARARWRARAEDRYRLWGSYEIRDAATAYTAYETEFAAFRGAETDFGAALTSAGLMTDYAGDGDDLRRMNALMALYYALDDQMGNAPGGGETPLQMLAKSYRRKALDLLLGITLRVSAETDPDADGYGVPDYELGP